jgi:hypothetical protein
MDGDYCDDSCLFHCIALLNVKKNNSNLETKTIPNMERANKGVTYGVLYYDILNWGGKKIQCIFLLNSHLFGAHFMRSL